MDLTIFNFLHFFADKIKFLDNLIIFFAEYLPYLLIIAAAFFLIRVNLVSIPKLNSLSLLKKRLAIFFYLSLSIIISRGIIAEAIRWFYSRPRPFQELNFTPLVFNESSSFPSGHAVFFFTLALTIFYFNRKWGWCFLGLVFINSIARIMAGVHWLSDILGGIIVATASFLIVQKLLENCFYQKSTS